MKTIGNVSVFWAAALAALCVFGCASTGGQIISESSQINDDYGNSFIEVTMRVPELDDIVSYEAYQNSGYAESLIERMREEFEVKDASKNLSETIKKYMRDRNIRVMFCYDYDSDYAIIRYTNPEAFATVILFVEQGPPDDFDDISPPPNNYPPPPNDGPRLPLRF